MARYGQAFKDRVVARLLPPESASVDEVAREVGIGAQTLERWRSDALSMPARERAARNPKRWSGRTRNWSRIDVVTLNPEREKAVAKVATGGADKKELAA